MQERKYETKTFNDNFAKKVQSNLPFAVPGNVNVKVVKILIIMNVKVVKIRHCIFKTKYFALTAAISFESNLQPPTVMLSGHPVITLSVRTTIKDSLFLNQTYHIYSPTVWCRRLLEHAQNK